MKLPMLVVDKNIEVSAREQAERWDVVQSSTSQGNEYGFRGLSVDATVLKVFFRRTKNTVYGSDVAER